MRDGNELLSHLLDKGAADNRTSRKQWAKVTELDAVPLRQYGMHCLVDDQPATRWCAREGHEMVWPNLEERPTILPAKVDAAARLADLAKDEHTCPDLAELREKLTALVWLVGSGQLSAVEPRALQMILDGNCDPRDVPAWRNR